MSIDETMILVALWVLIGYIVGLAHLVLLVRIAKALEAMNQHKEGR